MNMKRQSRESDYESKQSQMNMFEESEEEDYIRHLCVSKNKLNGWHGTVTCSIDIHRARYEL